MKPTQEQVIAWARDSGMELYGLGKDRAKFVYYLETFATLAYEAGRKDENEACAKVVEKIEREIFNAVGDPRVSEFKPKIADAIRARREQ